MFFAGHHGAAPQSIAHCSVDELTPLETNRSLEIAENSRSDPGLEGVTMLGGLLFWLFVKLQKSCRQRVNLWPAM